MFSILVVEGEGVITDSIKNHLASEVCQAVTVLNGEDAVQFALREMPSLIILDVMRSAFDVYQVIQQLRDHPKCMHIPIILLSPHGSLVDRVRAYELGVDSYIAKPFSIDEVLVHVRCHLRRMQQTTLSPLTQLPGGLQLERAIHYKLRGSDPWSVLYLDLDNFKSFNDAYGFLAGNDMILLVGHICQRVVCVYGNADDFVGHVGGDDFVIVTTPEREKALCRHILTRYKEESVALYRQEDLERGAIRGADREGHPFEFPLVSLSIGVVSDRFHGIHTLDDIGILTAEAKRLAKQSSNNVSHISLEWQHHLSDHFLGSHATYPLNLVAPFERHLFRFVEEDAYC
ncbi:MAG TPA: response regulator [Ktedonobacteraceae bacterium]|jgi:diguanylate cyclase (GGDEF)-like protein